MAANTSFDPGQTRRCADCERPAYPSYAVQSNQYHPWLLTSRIFL